ncbi:unnamed protein product [Caenorhabditis angaria]|uniref:Uncharacterized protein n=1 Tax=Caenorhabditis angaria TaxID=860376 RepID=A0A9P1IAQ6_9PELO|nr:unnamed protein product [Caenorhabditis angaria]
MSHFARSNAVQYNMSPRKQVSSPLPDQPRRIYERGHAHSRSWNPGVGSGPSPPPPPPIINQTSYRYFENKDDFVAPVIRMIEVPIINEPPSPTPREHSERRRSFVPRQAKSFDDRNPQVAADRRLALDQRSYTLAEKIRNEEEEEKVQVSVACQSLWAAKGHLEQLHALGISEPSSVSTSFESNTDSQATADTIEQQRNENAKGKRLQYKSLLLQRQFLSTAAVSSMESNISTDDSDPIFASSFDSTRSELERRRLSLLNQADQNDSDEACTSTQRVNHRDYSVDATSDSLFREWSRVDPAYVDNSNQRLQRGHTVDHSSHFQPNRSHFQRQFSLVASPMAQNHRRHTVVSYRDG